MANYTDEFSFILPMHKAEAINLYELIDETFMDHNLRIECGGFGIWISGENGFESEIADLIAEWLGENIPDFDPQIIQGAYYCSKPRVNEQGGWALKLGPNISTWGTWKFD